MFKDGVLPQKVFLGSMAITLRSTLNYCCTAIIVRGFGHVAGSCRGKRRWWRSYNTKWVQFVKDQCKVSYAEAVQRVAMMLGNQITKTNLSSAFPSDMFLNKESFLFQMCWWELRKQLIYQICPG